MKVRNLTTLLMTVSAVILTLTPAVAHALPIPVPSPEGVIKRAIRKVLGSVMPTMFEELGWPDILRWALTGIVMALSAVWILRLFRPKEGSDTLSSLGKVILAALGMSMLLGIALYYFEWAYAWKPKEFGKFGPLDLRDEIGWAVKIGVVVLFGGTIVTVLKSVGSGVISGMKMIWEKATSMGDGFALRLFAALFVSAVAINNHGVSNLSTMYAPSILSSLAGLYVLLFVKNDEGKSVWAGWRQSRIAKKEAQAQAAPEAQAPVASPVPQEAAQAPPVTITPARASLSPIRQRLEQHQRSYMR